MPEALAQGERDVHVTLGRVRIHVGGRTARDAADHLQRRAADADLVSEPAEFRPGRQALDEDVAAEAARIDRLARHPLEIVDAGQVYQRDGVGQRSEEHTSELQSLMRNSY